MADDKIFNSVMVEKPNFSQFDLSYDHKTSLKMGKLVPIHVQECLPSDTFRMSSEAMFRMMPMVAPIMHKVDVYIHHFFVPNRILWPNWEKFITGGENGTETPALPIIYGDGQAWTVSASTLPDYLGLPIGVDLDAAITGGINALPFAAYERIYHEYYRDQNLQAGDPYVCDDGVQSDPAPLLTLRSRAWEHDYFTSCLPFAQKGQPVTLPLEFGNVDVQLKQGWNEFPPVSNNPQLYVDAASGTVIPSVTVTTDASGQLDEGGPLTPNIDPNGTMFVAGDDLQTTTTINELRAAFSLQKWMEKNARGGSRYVENMLVHFGVRSQDARLQRPEYLGGSKCSMSISEVLQTSQSDTTPQGTMSGHGISVTGGQDFRYRCQEHGWIISILSIRPKTAYMQGIPKHFSKFDKLQYYWPDFAHLGEEPVQNRELYVAGTLEDNEGTFGYLPRYTDYRTNPSRVSGEMRDTLEYWHLARKFATAPSLNGTFIKCNPDTRIFAVVDDDQDQIVAHIYHKIEAFRPLPKYGNPGGI